MQVFIKLPYPYNKCKVFEIDYDITFEDLRNLINKNTCYSNIEYYFLNSTKVISEELNDITISEYNNRYPTKKIENEITLHLIIRSVQKNIDI